MRRQWSGERQAQLFGRRVWFLDEMGVNRAMTRGWGRAAGGARAGGTVPKNYGESVTFLGAMTGDGLQAALEVRGATDELVMLSFVGEVLSRLVRAGDVVVLDNLSSHKTQRVQQAFAALSVELWYLPPYSPDLNPIEKCWSKMKTYLREAAARSYEALSAALSAAMKTITAADARNWIRHCGYV
jgi:transposase